MCGVLGLELHIDEAEGYAFLRSVAEFEESPSPLPRLVARRPLTFQMSLLLVLLRKKLLELDTKKLVTQDLSCRQKRS